MSRIQANLLLLVTGAIWGLGFVSQSVAMDKIGPFLFVGLRFAIAFVTVLPLALRETRGAEARIAAADWRGFLLIGVFLFAGAATQQVGIMTTSVTNSGFLTGLYVVMVPFLGILLFRQRPHLVVWPAALSALAGIFLLSGGRIEALHPGDWLTILCALFWALQILFVTRVVGESGKPITLAATQFAVCAVLGIAVALIAEPVDWRAVYDAAPELLFSGIVSSGIAFTLQIVGQRHTTAPQAAIFLSSEALFAALFGAIVLGDRLPPSGLIGCLLIFAAMLAVELVPMLMPHRTLGNPAE